MTNARHLLQLPTPNRLLERLEEYPRALRELLLPLPGEAPHEVFTSVRLRLNQWAWEPFSLKGDEQEEILDALRQLVYGWTGPLELGEGRHDDALALLHWRLERCEDARDLFEFWVMVAPRGDRLLLPPPQRLLAALGRELFEGGKSLLSPLTWDVLVKVTLAQGVEQGMPEVTPWARSLRSPLLALERQGLAELPRAMRLPLVADTVAHGTP